MAQKMKKEKTEEQRNRERDKNIFSKKFKQENQHITKCQYCDLSFEAIKSFCEKNNATRGGKRGKSPETDRLLPKKSYKENYKQNLLRLACYICNNAKSDFPFGEDLFKDTIAKGIRDAVTQFNSK